MPATVTSTSSKKPIRFILFFLLRLRLTGDEVLCQGRACVFLSHDASEEEHRTAWAVIHNEVLTLAFGVARNGYDNASGLALDFTSVFLEIPFAAVVASE